MGLIEFPSKGLWSIVFVTGETTGEVGAVKPGGEEDLLTVFMPTGIVPPTGFVCFLPRRNVQFLDMNIEDAAKVIISAGMVTPESHEAQGARRPGAPQEFVTAAVTATGVVYRRRPRAAADQGPRSPKISTS